MPSDEEISIHRHSSSIIDKSDWVNMTLLECLEKSDSEIISILSRVYHCLVIQILVEFKVEEDLFSVSTKSLSIRRMRW